jgi:hypothetical protein
MMVCGQGQQKTTPAAREGVDWRTLDCRTDSPRWPRGRSGMSSSVGGRLLECADRW